MSLEEYKLPSLKDKIREQAEKAEEVVKDDEGKEVKVVKVIKKRRLSR